MSSPERIFGILETVVFHQDTGLTFAEVVSKSGYAKSSVHRILKELIALGYMNFNPETKRYRAGLKLATLGANVLTNFDLRDHVHPQLLALHKETEHTCHMGIKNGDMGVYLDKLEAKDYGIKLFSAVGKNFPLHCTAMGKVLLAYSPVEEMTRILARGLTAFTEKTITGPELLLNEFTEIRRLGYAVDREEITRGLMCIAAPVFGSDGNIVCALSITFPSYIYAERGIDAEVEAILKHTAAVSGNV